ncbi:MAG: GNAT family N-acetyltransferase [Flavobacteriaceae bacterium]
MNVRLKQLSKGDAPRLAELANNKKIWDNLRDYIPYPYTESDAEAFIDMTAAEHPPMTFGIGIDDSLCGVIGLVAQKDVYHTSAEIGYWIGEPFWGKGIGTKAVGMVTEYGFQKLGLERIHTGIFEFNTASMRILEKNGFKKEGVFRNAVVKNGTICDEHRYAILKKEYDRN